MVALCQKNFDSQPPSEPRFGGWTRPARRSPSGGSCAFHIVQARRLRSATSVAPHIVRVARGITPAGMTTTRRSLVRRQRAPRNAASRAVSRSRPRNEPKRQNTGNQGSLTQPVPVWDPRRRAVLTRADRPPDDRSSCGGSTRPLQAWSGDRAKHVTHGPRTHALAGARWRARCTPRARRDVWCLRRRCPAQKKLKIFPFFSCRPRARWRNAARVGTIEEQAPRRGYAAIARLDLAGASRTSLSWGFVLDCAMGNARVVRAVMVRAVAAKCGPTPL